MKKILVGVVALFALTGCGASRNFDGDLSNNLFVKIIDVDGQEVTCIIYDGPSRAGLDCDFG